MLLIIDNNENIEKYFTCESVSLDVSTYTLTETLENIKKYSQVTQIYFPLELKFKDTKRQHFSGLELLKHIRLTTDLGKLQYASILLGYTYPLETIFRNPESTILCSPGTHLFHLKNIQQVNSSKFFQSEEALTKDKLKPYILYTDTDEAKSDHDRRNEHGPLKLERELNETSVSDIGLDLWQKKLLFLQNETKTNEQTCVADADFKAVIKGKRILYLDDEADKWEMPLSKLFEGATLDIKKDIGDIISFLVSSNRKGEDIIDRFREKVNEFYELRSQIDAAQLLLNPQEEESSCTEDNSDLNYRLKTSIDAVQKSLKRYNDSLRILDTNPGDLNINLFYRNSDELLKQMRHVRTNFSMVYLSQQLSQNREEEDNNQPPVSPEYLLSMKNFHAEFVSDLRKILEYDLIILDLRLKPESDANSDLPSGISILKFIKSINPYIPILLFTASQNFNNINAAKELNKGGGYWIKNVSHANELRRDIINILVDPLVHEIYWKSKLILSKDIIEKYVVSNFGASIAREKINNNDLDVIKKSLKYFTEFYLNKNVSIGDFWINTFKLSEARFTVNKLGRLDRPQLIKLLNLDAIEYEFNQRRTHVAAQLGDSDRSEEKIKEEYELCKNYIDYSIEWLLNYLHSKG